MRPVGFPSSLDVFRTQVESSAADLVTVAVAAHSTGTWQTNRRSLGSGAEISNVRILSDLFHPAGPSGTSDLLGGSCETAAVQSGRYEPRGARLEIAQRVVVENDP